MNSKVVLGRCSRGPLPLLSTPRLARLLALVLTEVRQSVLQSLVSLRAHDLLSTLHATVDDADGSLSLDQLDAHLTHSLIESSH